MKKLNFTFKQRSQIAQAHLAKIRGKQISKEDDKDLLEFYYRIIDWAFDLRQLNYESGNNIPHVLRQAIRRLPSKFYGMWGEHCLKLC